MNGDVVTEKIADAKARVARLLKAKTPGDRIVEELYLATLCRTPTGEERENAAQFLKESKSPHRVLPGPAMGPDQLEGIPVRPLKDRRHETAGSFKRRRLFRSFQLPNTLSRSRGPAIHLLVLKGGRDHPFEVLQLGISRQHRPVRADQEGGRQAADRVFARHARRHDSRIPLNQGISF